MLARTGILAAGLLCLALRAWSQAPGPDVLRGSLITPGEARPILLYADQIVTWAEGGQRAFLLRGRVKLEQGLTSLSFTEGVAWLDEDRKTQTGVYALQVYAEGSLAFVNGS